MRAGAGDGGQVSRPRSSSRILTVWAKDARTLVQVDGHIRYALRQPDWKGKVADCAERVLADGRRVQDYVLTFRDADCEAAFCSAYNARTVDFIIDERHGPHGPTMDAVNRSFAETVKRSTPKPATAKDAEATARQLVEKVTGPLTDAQWEAEQAAVRAILDAPLSPEDEEVARTMFGTDAESRRYIRARENNRKVFGGAAE